MVDRPTPTQFAGSQHPRKPQRNPDATVAPTQPWKCAPRSHVSPVFAPESTNLTRQRNDEAPIRINMSLSMAGHRYTQTPAHVVGFSMIDSTIWKLTVTTRRCKFYVER
jgi:hypothetical protein